MDPAGRPLAGIQIGSALSDIHGVDKTREDLRMFGLRGLKNLQTTDAQGRFSLRPLVALHALDIGRSGALNIRPLAICFADQAMRRIFFFLRRRAKSPAPV